ncbi:ImmA/IrrE family metallo-endopeptidase [Microbacterium paraoxydans]|uniref:ImmA/IrrE family metallo-endopeptidase n=1 Tax=Microbacterium paraoxydans TaxID=199592 RepID=UPI00343E02E9
MDSKILELYDSLDTLGVRVEFCELPPDRDGEYVHDKRLIRIQHDLRYRRYVSTLAHECCHAVFGDVPTMFGPLNAKQERRADEWAAMQLIDPHDYRVEEARHDGHLEAMSIALRVTTDIVEAFRRVLIRIGEDVYVNPKMGAGQWAHRIGAA